MLSNNLGLKVDLETSSDAVEASALGYKDNHIHIYSNSWGPSDNGFIVEGPGPLAKKALFNGVTKVQLYYCGINYYN